MELEVQRLKEIKPGWFKRHLNWTLIITLLSLPVLSGFLYLIGLFVFSSAVGWESSLGLNIGRFLGIPYLIALILVNRWVLDQKGRRKAWLWLYSLIFIFLFAGAFSPGVFLFELFFFLVYIAFLMPVIITLLLRNNKSGQISH